MGPELPTRSRTPALCSRRILALNWNESEEHLPPSPALSDLSFGWTASAATLIFTPTLVPRYKKKYFSLRVLGGTAAFFASSPETLSSGGKLAWVPYLKTNRLSCNRNRKVWWAAACSLTALTASSSWPLLTAANAVTAAPISKAADYSSWFKQFFFWSMSLVCDIQFQNEHSKEK